ncbi:MAG: hypothetical protein A2Y89_00505 [Chloroflexi bacterium RBG_13_51_18]|nr:MAG: hypothetical protein A2Y89_00505 [Chloroflexi bacterium RBG_13_51_18]
MRVLAVVVILLGLAGLIFGLLFLPQASSGEQEIANSIAPLTLDQVNDKYDAVAAKYDQIKMAEEPQIQAGQAMPSAMYNYLSAQRALLGLAKSNMGTAKFVRLNGIIDIMVGLGLIAAGSVLLIKNWKAA